MTTLFLHICYMSMTGSYVLLMVLAARLLLWKCPRKYTYFLWLLVFLRFACPVFPEGPFSLLPASNVRISAEIGIERMMSQGRAFGMMEENGADQNGQKETKGQPAALTEHTDGEEADVLTESGREKRTNIPGRLRSFLLDFRIWLPWVWFFGAAVFLLYHALSYIRLKQRLLGAEQSEPGVYEIDWGSLSFVAGLIHPAIYISKDLALKDRAVILCHERVHSRRKDYLSKPAALVICCVHWFNPFVWLAFHLMSQDMETSCDEQVLEELGERSKETYSRALLHAAKARQSGRCTMLSFGENGVKQRIRHMLTYRRGPFWVAAVSIALLVLLAVGLLMNPKSGGRTEEDIMQAVRTAGGYDETAEARCFARDYDGDGRVEGYVEIGSPEERYIRGDLWFVSAKGRPQRLRENILMEMEQAYFEQEGDIYLLMSYIDGNPLLTDVYGVYDGSYVLWQLPSPERKYVENGTLMCVASDYDMSYDIGTEAFFGHTQKAYPYYYEKNADGDSGYIGEYEAAVITREDVKKYENGQEILQAIEKANPGCRYEYLLRENGLLHINRAQLKGDFLEFAYTTCQVKENRITLLEEGDGCYRRVLYSEIDEVPEAERENFAQRIAKEYSQEGYDPEEGAYRKAAEEVRHCLENEDVDGLYGRMAEEVYVFGDAFIEKAVGDFFRENQSENSDHAFLINSWSSFSDYYDEIFTSDVKDMIFGADFGELSVNYSGVVQVGEGRFGLIFGFRDGRWEVTQIYVR